MNDKNTIIVIFTGVFIYLIITLSFNDNEEINKKYKAYNYIEEPSYSYDDGYYWAEENDIYDEYDCSGEFGSGTDAEEGCSDYIYEYEDEYEDDYYTQTFMGYECIDDCSGHEAGYYWAEENDIYDEYDCDGYSDSFIEGCISYVESYY